MRSLIVIVCCLLAAPSFGQEVFRALPIDEIQDNRIEASEQRIDQLERSVASLARSVEKLVERQSVVAPPAVQMASVQAPAKITVQAAPVQQPQRQVPNRWTQSELDSIVRSKFPNGWSGEYANVSPRSDVWNHLIYHGFTADQVNGLDQNTALGLHALEHAGQISPYRSQNWVSTPAPQQSGYSVAVSANVATGAIPAAYDDGCSNGQCPLQQRPLQQPQQFNSGCANGMSNFKAGKTQQQVARTGPIRRLLGL